MLGLLIAFRNLLLAVLLGWIGFDSAPADAPSDDADNRSATHTTCYG